MMAEPVPISLGYRSNPARNPAGGAARLINCFAEEQGEDGKAPWLLYGMAGLEPFGSPLEGGGIRAMIEASGLLYVICGRRVYMVTTAGVATQIGGIASDGPVYVAKNRRIPTQIGIVTGGLYYVIDTLANSVTQIIDPDLPAPISISVLDGYGILPTELSKFFITGIDELTTIDALDFATAEAFPDFIVRTMVLERELIILKTGSIEFFQNTGGADFPFTRVHAMEIGCLSGDSVALVDTPSRKTVIFVAPDHTVRRLDGYSANVISTNDIEAKIHQLHEDGEIGQLRALAYAEAGRFFYCLSSDRFTFCYDTKTQMWHERKSYGLDRWRVSAVASFGNRMIAGDYVSGQMFIIDEDSSDEDGDHLVMTVQTPTVHAFPYKVAFNALYIDAATGIGMNSTSVHQRDPKIMVSWSDDGGYSYSAQRERALGKLAQTFRRVPPIYRLGRTGQKGRIFKFDISSPVRRLLMQVSIDQEILRP